MSQASRPVLRTKLTRLTNIVLRSNFPVSNGLRAYFAALALICAATVVSDISLWLTGPRDLSLPFIVALVLTGCLFGLRPALAAAVVAFLFYNFFLVIPRFSLSLNVPDIVALASFLAAALLVGTMAGQLSDRARTVTYQLRHLATLFAASRDLSAATTEDSVARTLARNLKSGGNAEVAIWRHDQDERRLLAATQAAIPCAAETNTASAGQALAGRSIVTRTLRNAKGDIVALAEIWIDNRATSSGANKWQEALLQLGAIALDRVRLSEDISQARLVAEREHLRTTLLSSLSHDLRTPISTILASASSLADYDAQFDLLTRRELLETIQEQADRLNRYVANLLDMTRLESGVLDLKRNLVDPVEAINSALEHTRHRRGNRQIQRHFDVGRMSIDVDPVLLEQALVNIIENAVDLSPPDSIIRTSARIEGNTVVLAITDQGPGISADEIPRIFDKFFRGQADRQKARGVGLGLAVAKGIVEAFGGKIAVESPVNNGCGARFLIRLPAQEPLEARE